MSGPDLRVFPSPEAACHALADEVARALSDAVDANGRATLVLSGGSTPRRLHELLAEREDIRWPRIHVLFGDERFVPHDSPTSNFGMARRSLLDDVPIPPANQHPWRTDLPTLEDAARAMRAELARLFGHDAPPRFDVLLLGIGADGHTASLFPDSRALAEGIRWTMPTLAPDEPRERLTMTLPVLNAAHAVHFLAAGAGKREALRSATNAPERGHCPASLIRPTDGTLTWWLDEEAAP